MLPNSFCALSHKYSKTLHTITTNYNVYKFNKINSAFLYKYNKNLWFFYRVELCLQTHSARHKNEPHWKPYKTKIKNLTIQSGYRYMETTFSCLNILYECTYLLHNTFNFLFRIRCTLYTHIYIVLCCCVIIIIL